MEATFTPDAALQVCPNLRKGGAVSQQPAPVSPCPLPCASPAPHPLMSENLFCPTFQKKNMKKKKLDRNILYDKIYMGGKKMLTDKIRLFPRFCYKQ